MDKTGTDRHKCESVDYYYIKHEIKKCMIGKRQQTFEDVGIIHRHEKCTKEDICICIKST